MGFFDTVKNAAVKIKEDTENTYHEALSMSDDELIRKWKYANSFKKAAYAKVIKERGIEYMLRG
ncbi:MAG TPA: hypothetical protein ENN84_08585 [Candidatus Marinimicrobia bacterium]|nr:hypothetical protein [Candidatus Neomarinimicrobiota bacterium]